jgi:hypothetical protein
MLLQDLVTVHSAVAKTACRKVQVTWGNMASVHQIIAADWTLNKKAKGPSETSLLICKTTWRHMPEGRNLDIQGENKRVYLSATLSAYSKTLCCPLPQNNNIRSWVQHFLPLVLLSLCALLLTVVGLLCIGLLFLCVFLLIHVYCCTVCVLLCDIL